MVRKRGETPLTIVAKATTPPPPPASLKQSSRSFWHAAHSDFDISDVLVQQQLEQICIAIDRVAELRAHCARDGDVLTTPTGRLKLHPAVAIEERLRGFIVRSIEKLRPVEKNPVGRPSTPIGWRGY